MTYIKDEILAQVEKPARYTGGEWNSVVKDKNAVDIRFAFCFADVYDIGMSHLGYKLIYHLLNDRKTPGVKGCWLHGLILKKNEGEQSFLVRAGIPGTHK